MTLIDQIKRDEGFRADAYPDPLTGGDPWTIGYGCATGVKKGDTTTEPEAAEWLERHVELLRQRLSDALPWFKFLDGPRQDVLVNMAYNMGLAALLEFTHTLDAVAHARYDAAADGMLQSLWAKQVPQRADRLAVQMRTGVPQ